MTKFEILKREIMNLSVSNVWEEAKAEWNLENIEISDEPRTCLCTHFPILELCYISNEAHSHVLVGNCCIKQFLGLPSDKIFASLKRITKDPAKGLNEETIAFALSKRWITKWEEEFCRNTSRKRNLSEKQLNVRKRVNAQILYYVKNDVSRGAA
jgi:hypothetical protein